MGRARERRDPGELNGIGLLHELLLRLDYSIEVHPAASSGASGRPDFLARRSGGAGFYLEARVAAAIPSRYSAVLLRRVTSAGRALEAAPALARRSISALHATACRPQSRHKASRTQA